MIKKINLLFLTFFMIGRIKYAPGTITSLVILIIWYFIPNSMIVQLPILCFHLLFGFYFCFRFTKNNLDKDPSYIVIDEVVGMMISLFLLPKEISLYIMAFILFRFFDIIKPSIIDRSQEFKFGVGIMADDIISGILTLLIIKGLYL